MSQASNGAQLLLERLVHEIAEIAPPGLGEWEEAWRLVDPASADFLIEVSRWEHEDQSQMSTRDRLASARRVTRSYRSLLEAWRHAADAYRSTHSADLSDGRP